MPKFISELRPESDPNDAEEMVRHVFGQNYKTDDDGNPVEQGLGSIAHMKSGKHPGSLEQHFVLMAKHEGVDAANKARADYEDKYKKQAEKNREKHRQSLAKVPKVEEAF